MDISKTFDFSNAESKWYNLWIQSGLFNSSPDERESYSIVMPPPNVTGVLHMGHALNNTVQDILIRRAKAEGYNTCWVPGTDHASIATEAKVVALLKEKGIQKNDLSREEFLSYAYEWKDKYGGIILEQLKKLGCALDWNRTNFTMNDEYYKAVIAVFVDLYNKGYIYRGVKMINWDPQALTALSDEEVFFKESQSQLYYIQYKIDNEEDDEYITIATVRPETIMGDTAICVHPEDPRFAHLRGCFAIVPLINRRVPIIFDDYIDMEFGTGALKVTPAHDINDYNLGIKHKLQIVDTLNDDGTMSEASQIFIGEDRFEVRKKIVKELEQNGCLVKTEQYKNQVGVSERTGAVIEPRLSMQWWCKVEDMVTPALEAVMKDDINFYPSKYKNLYRHWMTSIKDWNISRQLWWGQRIPAWYDTKGNIYVGINEEDVLSQYKKKNPDGAKEDLIQDSDVLDTWFSSWFWPMEVFGWNKDSENADLNYYYPTDTLVTGPDIIFFWVARMIMAGYEYKGEKPFENVYFTGLIRDKQGRKMSKQLGNSPDLLQLIADHGADAVRFSVMISSPAGNDILYDEAFLEQGRNFINKMWNAQKLIKIWEQKIDENNVATTFASQWMHNNIIQQKDEISKLFKEYRLSEALKKIYSLIWNDFCSCYLEWIKPGIDENIGRGDFDACIAHFKELLHLLHPFMPFITEELNHNLSEGTEFLMAKTFQKEEISYDEVLSKRGELLQEIITGTREVRNQLQIKPKESIKLYYESNNENFYLDLENILAKQINASVIAPYKSDDAVKTNNYVIGNEKLYLYSENTIDTATQIEKMEEELNYLQGFLNSVNKKLSNEKFVSNAKPEIVAVEQKKKADAEQKINTIIESLESLKQSS